MSSKNRIYSKKYEKVGAKVTLSDNEVRVLVTKNDVPIFRLKTKGKVTVSTPKLLTGIIDVIAE